jgi:hypothetical protein
LFWIKMICYKLQRNSKMKLIDFKITEDFGKDLYIYVLKGRRFTLLELCFSWSDFGAWPYLQFQFGNGQLFGLISWIGRFGFDFSFCGRTWWNDTYK